MKLRLTAVALASCALSMTASAQCKQNSASQQFCVGDIVYTQYDAIAQVKEFNQSNRPTVIVLKGKEKGEHQTFEIDLLYSTKQDCILDFCIGTKVRREDQNDFTRTVVGLNKVQNTVMYTNLREKQYSVRPGQLISITGHTPTPVPNPTPTPNPLPAPNPSPDNGAGWSADNTVDIDGLAQSQASVSSDLNATTLIMSCEAPSVDMKLKIKTDMSYNSAVMSVLNDPKQLLFVQLIVDSEAIELTSWQAEGSNIIAQVDALYPDEVARIKRGSSLKLVILTDTSSESEEEIVLHEQNFSLKGSHDAISKAQKHCAEGNSKI
jgi:hypothetical protein